MVMLSIMTPPLNVAESVESNETVNEPPESVDVDIPLPPDILSSSVPPCRYIPVESSAITLNIVSLASACLTPPAVLAS